MNTGPAVWLVTFTWIGLAAYWVWSDRESKRQLRAFTGRIEARQQEMQHFTRWEAEGAANTD